MLDSRALVMLMLLVRRSWLRLSGSKHGRAGLQDMHGECCSLLTWLYPSPTLTFQNTSPHDSSPTTFRNRPIPHHQQFRLLEPLTPLILSTATLYTLQRPKMYETSDGYNLWLITYTTRPFTTAIPEIRVGKTMNPMLVEDLLYRFGADIPCKIEGRNLCPASLSLHMRMRGTDGGWRPELNTTLGCKLGFSIFTLVKVLTSVERRGKPGCNRKIITDVASIRIDAEHLLSEGDGVETARGV